MRCTFKSKRATLRGPAHTTKEAPQGAVSSQETHVVEAPHSSVVGAATSALRRGRRKAATARGCVRWVNVTPCAQGSEWAQADDMQAVAAPAVLGRATCGPLANIRSQTARNSAKSGKNRGKNFPQSVSGVLFLRCVPLANGDPPKTTGVNPAEMR